MIKIDILTLFPKMFQGPFAESIVKRAMGKGLITVNLHDLRQWTADKHQTVDDRPFGGGVGMVLMVEPIYKALKELTPHSKTSQQKVILLTPQGKVFNQKIAGNLSKQKHLILICGHYEGVDERIREFLVDEEISIGDYVLTGGELPAMVMTDAITRLLPGVLKKSAATRNESFANPLPVTRHAQTGQLLEYPQYTRPADFQGWKVPAVLLSGDHAKVAAWQAQQALKRTRRRRPDLL